MQSIVSSNLTPTNAFWKVTYQRRIYTITGGALRNVNEHRDFGVQVHTCLKVNMHVDSGE